MRNVICLLDDVFLFSENQVDYDKLLHDVLSRLSAAGVTLNRSKCKFSVTNVRYLGHIITSDGISPDPEKLHGISHCSCLQALKGTRDF